MMSLQELLENVKSSMESLGLCIAFIEVDSNSASGITHFDEHVGSLTIPENVTLKHAQELSSCDFIERIKEHSINSECHWITSGHNNIVNMDYSMSIDANSKVKITLSWPSI